MSADQKKTLKVRYMSDLHLEFMEEPPATVESIGEDVVILAGDIHVGTKGIQWAKEAFAGRQVVYVLGNHEFYGRDWEHLLDEARVAAHGSNVTLLERNAVAHMGVVFVGCTLWTDFNLYGPANQMRAMGESGRGLSDYHVIKNGLRLLRPSDVLERHGESVSFLEEWLAHRRRPLVVITHHSPTEATGDPQYRGDILTAAYISKLDHLVRRPAVAWIHGHTHHSTTADVNDTPVMVNTAGYPGRDEDPAFRWDAYFEVPLEPEKQLTEFELIAAAMNGVMPPVPPPSSQPVVYLDRWGAFRVGDCIHLKGLNTDPWDWNVKVSSPIVGYDRKRLEVKTRSGRVYRLVSLPGGVEDRTESLLSHWLKRNGLKPTMLSNAAFEVLRNLGLNPSADDLARLFRARLSLRRKLDREANEKRWRKYKKERKRTPRPDDDGDFQ